MTSRSLHLGTIQAPKRLTFICKSGDSTLKTLPTFLTLSVLAFATFAQPDPVAAQPKGCPPGLAKKNPPCVPPGQAKKRGSQDEWLYDRSDHAVDRDNLIFLDDYWRYDLPRLPSNQRYAVLDNRIVVIDRESYQILQLIKVFTALTR